MKNKKNKGEEPKEVDREKLRNHLMDSSKPGIRNRIEFADDVIDLHMEIMGKRTGDIPAQDILFYQLEEFERALDRAIAAGKLEFRVVHGHGKGKLRQEIYKLLEANKQVKSFINDYHSRYGYGSTIIHFY